MKPTRTLRLKKEVLAELSTGELRAVVAGYTGDPFGALTKDDVCVFVTNALGCASLLGTCACTGSAQTC